jgi:ABC-type transport system substrate-binding protein
MPRRAKLHLKQARIAVIPSETRNLLFPATRHSPLATLFVLLASLLPCVLISCSRPTKFDPTSLTFLIEANPVNLDPRFATDGQSQRLDGLIFSGLLARDAQMNLTATSPNPGKRPIRSLTFSI